LCLVLVNGLALSRWRLESHHRRMAARVEELQQRMKPGSRVVTVKDSLELLPRDFPLDRSTRDLHIIAVVTPGVADAPRWRSRFRELVDGVWKGGGNVWIARRLLAEAPPVESAWVEGDDPRIKWADLHSFFSRLDVDETVGGEDGFARLLPSDRTRQALGAGE
jgi:hypothetical protein